MKRLLVPLCAALFLFGNSPMAQTPAKKIFPYEYTTNVLDNGLTVILIPMSSNGLVSYYSVVRTGSRDEWEPGHTGFAHFFEHMMFRGTRNFPAEKYDRMITEMGADANAYTTDDLTAYHLSFTSDDLETVIRLESDRFQNLYYEEPAFQTEAGAVYGEYRKNKTSPWMVLEETLLGTAFTTHTYKHTTMGFESDIKAMPTMYEYSKSFFSRYYRPENVVIVIAGDFRPRQVMDWMRQYYGSWQKGYVPPRIAEEPVQTGEKTASVTYEGKTLPILTIANKGARFDPGDRTAAAARLFGELAFGETSDLYKRLMIKEQKVQMLMSDIGMNRDPGLWSVIAMIRKPSDIPYVKERVLETVTTFQSTPVDAKRLADLKSRLRYGFLMNLDTPEKVAGSLARFAALTGGIDAVDALYGMYETITPQDVMDAVNTYFTPQSRTIVTLTGSK